MTGYFGYWIIMLCVCPSTRLSVMLCIVPFSVGVERQKLYQHVLSRQLPIHFFRHFRCKMNRLATKRTEKNELEKRYNSLFRHRQCRVDWIMAVTYLLVSCDSAQQCTRPFVASYMDAPRTIVPCTSSVICSLICLLCQSGL